MPNLETRRWRPAQFEEFRKLPKPEAPKELQLKNIAYLVRLGFHNYMWKVGSQETEFSKYSTAEIDAALNQLAEIIADTMTETLTLLKVLDVEDVRFRFWCHDKYSKTYHLSHTTNKEWSDSKNEWYFAHNFNVSVWVIKELVSALLRKDYRQLIRFRGYIAHEMFHVYAERHYSFASDRCIKANQADDAGDPIPYILDFDERGANLFELQYLRYLSTDSALCRVAKQVYLSTITRARTSYHVELKEARISMRTYQEPPAVRSNLSRLAALRRVFNR